MQKLDGYVNWASWNCSSAKAVLYGSESRRGSCSSVDEFVQQLVSSAPKCLGHYHWLLVRTPVEIRVIQTGVLAHRDKSMCRIVSALLTAKLPPREFFFFFFLKFLATFELFFKIPFFPEETKFNTFSSFGQIYFLRSIAI